MADGGQPVAGGSGANNVAQNQNIIVNPAAQNAAAQLAQQILANTRIDECHVSDDWNDTTTFANYWNKISSDIHQ